MSGLVSNCFPVLNMVGNKYPYYEVFSHCTKNGKGTVTSKSRPKPHNKYSNKTIIMLKKLSGMHHEK